MVSEVSRSLAARLGVFRLRWRLPRLASFDRWLVGATPRSELRGLPRAAAELLFFGIKEARACLFVALFFGAVFSIPRAGILGLPRYDALLAVALAIQAFMLWTKLETVDEVKAITLFHAVGFALEVF